MTVEADDRGRLYLASELRDRYGERFHIVEYQNRIELIPVDENPFEGLRDAVGDAFEDESVDELRERARAKATEEARADVRRD
ncbi:AbrB/MazE/SpoVT family DNA-binding domain-containing protein [Halorientalis marina]|jgi:hypothetical protein|uniref:AbrB/MazE/SpoVT family DNA-binding domain-containing protein n=1 Tax=Halorientalis marina TaxID=2931976 RepID=UPI001FF4957E|nr:AbrB/MazE/SpoVT family DNA-binding domain-containing protein [Halorientalis marina]